MQTQVTIHNVILFYLLLSIAWTPPVSAQTQYRHLASSPASALDNRCEVRGVWLNPYAFSTEPLRVEILEKLNQANLNTVFVIAPSVDNNKGWSETSNFYQFVEQATASGLSVHVWVANRFRDGEVDFRQEAEQQAQKEWVLNLLDKYPQLDGVHFDYIRYGTWETVNNAGKMDGVTNTIAESYNALKAAYPQKKLTSTSFVLGPGYVNQQEDVPDWFREWFAANPDNPFTNPYGDGRNTVPVHMKYQQNPVGWIDKGIVDAVIPMQYTTDDELWNQDVATWKEFLQSIDQDVSKLYMGLGWWEEEGKSHWGYDAAGVVRKIKYGRSQGLQGFVIFQMGEYNSPGHGEIDWELVEALSVDSDLNDFAAPFKEPVPSCLAASDNEPAASGKMSLSVNTFQTEFYPGDAVEAKIEISNAEDLYELQVSCQTNPSALSWQNAEFGAFFTDPLIGTNRNNSDLGTWTTAVSQKNPAPPLSGNGSFALLTLEAISPGTTTIECEPLASDRNGVEMAVANFSTTITILEPPFIASETILTTIVILITLALIGLLIFRIRR